MTVIAVGHTHTKFHNLLKMIPDNFTVVKVFNGDGHREDAICVPNDPQGRDVAMYKAGVDEAKDNRFVFLNDDVQHLSEKWWRCAELFLRWKTEPVNIIGVPNLSSWVDRSKLSEEASDHAESQGTDPLFLRTSAFMATRDYFMKLWKLSGGDAQVFEKASLKEAGRAHLIDPTWAYDSNTEQYV